MDDNITLSHRDVIAIAAALRAGHLTQLTRTRLQNLLASRPPVSDELDGGFEPGDLRAVRRAPAILTKLRAIVRHADAAEGLVTLRASNAAAGCNAVLRLPKMSVHKWDGRAFLTLPQPGGMKRSINLGHLGSPETAQRYREVIADYLAELFGRPPGVGPTC